MNINVETRVAEDEVIERLHRVVGYVSPGMRDLLHVLTHPDVVDQLDRYVQLQKERDRLLKEQAALRREVSSGV